MLVSLIPSAPGNAVDGGVLKIWQEDLCNLVHICLAMQPQPERACMCMLAVVGLMSLAGPTPPPPPPPCMSSGKPDFNHLQRLSGLGISRP